MTATTDLLSLIQSFRIIGRNRLDDAFDWLERKAGALEEVTRFHFTTGHNLKDQPEVRIHIMLNTRAEAMRWGSMHLPEFTEINGRYFECVLPNLTVLLHPMENLR